MKHINNRRGGVLSFVLVTFAVVTAFGTALASLSLVQNTMATRETQQEQSYLSAKSVSQMITSDANLLQSLAQSAIGKSVSIIDEEHEAYASLGLVDITLSNTYLDPLTGSTKVNVTVSAIKNGVQSDIKSVWRQLPGTIVDDNGLSFYANFKVTDCKPSSLGGNTTCTDSRVAPEEVDMLIKYPGSAQYPLEDYTIVDEKGEAFIASKTTKEQQEARFEAAYVDNNVPPESEYTQYKDHCQISGQPYAQGNPFDPSEVYFSRFSVKNTSNCIIETKSNRDPVSQANRNNPQLVYFDIPQGETLNVVIEYHKDEVDHLNSWENNTTFFVLGEGTLNIIYSYQANNDARETITLPQITQKDNTKTKVNVFLPYRKDSNKTITETLIMNYGHHNPLASNNYHPNLQTRDGSIQANIYMPNTDLVVNGVYQNLPYIMRSPYPLIDGNIVTRSIGINKAKNYRYDGQAHTGEYYTSSPWVIVNTQSDSSSTIKPGVFIHETFSDH